MHERVNFVAGEDALCNVGIVCGEGLSVFQRVGVNDDKAAGPVGERAGENDLSGLVQRIQSVEMRLAMDRAFGLTVRSVVPDDGEARQKNPG